MSIISIPSIVIGSALPASDLIYQASEKYGIDQDVLYNVLYCESTLNPNAQGDWSTTTKSYTSFGIAQIHLPSHPEITKDQALDPVFAIDWTAKQMSEGRSWQWTCWNMKYGALKKLSTTTPLLNTTEVLYYEDTKGRELARA